MLLRRDEGGDHGRARELLEQAIAQYGALGMPEHLGIAKRMLDEA
jgi:hypothetical protein